MACRHLKNIKGFETGESEREVCMFLFEVRGYRTAPCCSGDVEEIKCKDYEESDGNNEEENMSRL